MLLVLSIDDLKLVHLDVVGVGVVLGLVCNLATERVFGWPVCSRLLMLGCVCTLHFHHLSFKFDC